MIRLNKPVKLLEWGEGTNTLNQIWIEIGQGSIRSVKQKDGLSTMVVEMSGRFEKKNPKDDAIKVAQPGEGMTARSQSWGEVAMGRLKSIQSEGSRSLIYIEISTAAKIGKARLS